MDYAGEATARLLGESAAMRLVRQQVRALGPLDTTVLIEGETGTGKELVARAIHQTSPRRHGPFVVLSGVGLTELVVASRWFEFMPGSLGGVPDRTGLLERARGGTLLFDDLADLPLHLQGYLLRVLEERETLTAGATARRSIDVRVVASTRRHLEREAAAGRFRQDLLYRIRVARIMLPPLRQRRDDIPLLAETLVRRAAGAHGKAVRAISPDAVAQLVAYRWPGNVRELEAAIEWAVAHASQDTIQPSDLPSDLSAELVPPPRARLSALEKRRLLDVLQQTGGNRSVAARLLGISRATLYRRLAVLDSEDRG